MDMSEEKQVRNQPKLVLAQTHRISLNHPPILAEQKYAEGEYRMENRLNDMGHSLSRAIIRSPKIEISIGLFFSGNPPDN